MKKQSWTKGTLFETHAEILHQSQSLPVFRVAQAELSVRVQAAGENVRVGSGHQQRVVRSTPYRLGREGRGWGGEGRGAAAGGLDLGRVRSCGRLGLEPYMMQGSSKHPSYRVQQTRKQRSGWLEGLSYHYDAS